MAAARTAGFWSYAHRDDEAEQGRLVKLSVHIRREYELLTGQQIEVFVDRDDISWGTEWRSRIDEALQVTTFFIAIVTPLYLQSAECRRELLHFVGLAKSFGMQELFLPILYAPIPELNTPEDSADEIVGLIAETQWMNWTQIRLADERSTEYRSGVNKLATRLVEIGNDLQVQQVQTSSPTPPPNAPDNEPGYLDLMAEAEVAFPRWADTVQRLGACLVEFNSVVEPLQQQVEASDRSGAGARGRIVILHELTQALDPIANEITDLGHKYASDLIEIDPAILTILRLVSESPDEVDRETTEDFFANIEYLAKSASDAMGMLRQFVEQLNIAGRMSRELRRTTSKISTALQSLIDGQELMDGWMLQIVEQRRSGNPS